jgi:hypothetical protein
MKTITLTLAAAFLTMGVVSCSRTMSVRDAREEAAYSVRIDRDASSSALNDLRADESPKRSRVLAFEMSGHAEQPSMSPTAEARAAATQAAVIDAFVKALIEARRSRGQSTGDFTQRIGPRLTVTHRAIGDGYEATLSLTARGIETVFVVRDGVLRHPPQEFRLLRQVFAETGGEFELLTTDWSPILHACQARVACYAPKQPEISLAGDPIGTQTESP